MSIFTALYNLLIAPLVLFFEVIYALAYRATDNPGLSIIFLSLTMNFLVLPLYKQADAMQAEERETEKRLEKWVGHIKKTFSGDERYMMLQTYYRQNGYKPTDALKGSVSLLLEIPFFIAAYKMLSSMQVLQGVQFGPIHDLGAPDGMLVLGGLTINVLPILMTVINLVSSAIYSQDLTKKSKIQLYVMAGLFLVLLYESPAGLVFYWTLNNIFSLVKNIFYRLKNPKLVLSVLASLFGLAMMGVVLFIHPMTAARNQALVLAALALLQLPLLLHVIAKHSGKVHAEPEVTKKDDVIFFSGCLFVALLTGLLIPSAVIGASPAEFINVVTLNNPMHYIINTFLLALGIFVVWFGIFYMLLTPTGKKTMSFGMLAFSGAAVVDYMFFGKTYGTLNPALKYDNLPVFLMKDQLMNILVLAAVIAVLFVVWKKRQQLVSMAYLVLCLAVVGMSAFNLKTVHDVSASTLDQLEEAAAADPSIPLSTDGQNVVVLMMDRAISGYIPYIFNEKPEVAEQFDGFTYYPNTMSYGGATNVGVPPVYGGYDYVPKKMNERSDESLASKQNEALKVMPVLFDENDFEVTVCDPTYANYKWIPDLSIYDEYPDINKFITKGKYEVHALDEANGTADMLNRDLLCYSLFKVSPVFAQPIIYSDGMYNDADALYAKRAAKDSEEVVVEYTGDQTLNGPSQATGFRDTFMQGYGVLKNMSVICDIQESDENTFLMMSNDTTHDPMMLKEPEYEPVAVVDNTAYDAAHTDRFTLDGRTMAMNDENQVIHYHSNMAAMIQLGNWFDWLRENDLYDNTRIIIVADHGFGLGQFDNLILGKGEHDNIMHYNPLFMVKDFNAKGFTTDNQFMTNADTVTIAMEGLIENPMNPFTGNPINSDAKEGPQDILYTYWDTSVNNGNTFMPGQWLTLHDNIFDPDCWTVSPMEEGAR